MQANLVVDYNTSMIRRGDMDNFYLLSGLEVTILLASEAVVWILLRQANSLIVEPQRTLTSRMTSEDGEDLMECETPPRKRG